MLVNFANKICLSARISVSDLIFVTNIISGEKLSYREILAFHVWQLWGIWQFLYMSKNGAQKYICGEKMTKMMYISFINATFQATRN